MQKMKNIMRIMSCPGAKQLLKSMKNNIEMDVDYFTDGENDIVEKIACVQPDAVILDLFAPHSDAVEIVRAYTSLYADSFTYFAVICPFLTNRLRHELNQCGVNKLICRPYHERDMAEMLAEVTRIKTSTIAMMKGSGIHAIHKIHHMHGVSTLTDAGEVEAAIDGILRELGVPCAGIGYEYLKSAVMLAVTGQNRAYCVTKEIYPAVGAEFGATPSCVERRIRLTINEAWRSSSGAVIAAYFGNTVDNMRGKPSNCEFIAMIADRIRLDMMSVGKEDKSSREEMCLLAR